jgi:hypothetical protein
MPRSATGLHWRVRLLSATTLAASGAERIHGLLRVIGRAPEVLPAALCAPHAAKRSFGPSAEILHVYCKDAFGLFRKKPPRIPKGNLSYQSPIPITPFTSFPISPLVTKSPLKPAYKPQQPAFVGLCCLFTGLQRVLALRSLQSRSVLRPRPP